MPKQKVPDLEFDYFTMSQIPQLFDQKSIFINDEYQRGDIWTHTQKIELIKSIVKRYSIGVLVLYVNDNKQYEILDGQQRLNTIMQYMTGVLDLSDTDIQIYEEMDTREKSLIDAYCIYYLKLKSHDRES